MDNSEFAWEESFDLLYHIILSPQSLHLRAVVSAFLFLIFSLRIKFHGVVISCVQIANRVAFLNNCLGDNW